MLPEQHCNIIYEKSITSWDEGLPLGNGDMGCLIWGKARALRFSIDKSDLWDCSNPPQVGGDFTYAALKQFVKGRKKRKIINTFDTPYNNPTPTKLPAGKIILDLHCEDEIRSELDLSSAQAQLSAGAQTLRTFLHAEKTIGFLSIDSSDCTFRVENPEFGLESQRSLLKKKPSITQSLKNVFYEAPDKGEKRLGDSVLSYFTQKVNDQLTYGIFLGVKKTGSGLEAAYTVVCGANSSAAQAQGFQVVADALEQGYEMNLKSHLEWWKQYWEESYIRLPDSYFEKNWYITNYLLASASRESCYPMPLQGVWTADNGQLPPWKGDYHFDLNIQLTYLSYLKANHLSCGKSYLNYLLSLEPAAEQFAKDFYGAEGLCLPSVIDLKGNALGGWAMYALSPANQAWLCHGIKQYYDYTGDQVYLKEKAYPYLKKYGRFLLSILEKDENGKLVFPLSSSPETHDNTLKSWLKPNSNYDAAMLQRQFTSLFELAEQLGYTAEAAEWQTVLNSLAPLAVSPDNVLMLSKDERQKKSHRHLSHLIGIYPLELMAYDSQYNKRVIDASLADLERLGTSEYCGYSYAWLANLYCVQKNGEQAFRTLDDFWRYFCLPNGLHINGDYLKTGRSKLTYRPFTLEGNFCAAAALQEMLLSCKGNTIELFPAVPAAWREASFHLLAHNGVEITCVLAKGILESVTLKARASQTVCLKYGELQMELFLQAGETKTVAAAQMNQ